MQKNIILFDSLLQMLHIYLFGPSRTVSLSGNVYSLVVLNDYSRYTWTIFLFWKRDVFPDFQKLAYIIHNEKGASIVSIRSDHSGEFQNEEFEKLCNKNGI